MSYNIPITFDDSPFFDWENLRRPQTRRNYQSSGRWQPSVFGQWTDPEFFHDYPTRKQHYRSDYRGNEPQYERQSTEENKFDDEGAREDMYDTEEHRGAPGSNFGYDGWVVPVQYMDRPSHKHHKHKHKQVPKQKSKVGKVHHNINEEPGQRLGKVNKTSKADKATSDSEAKTEHSNESVKVETDKRMESQSNEEPNAEIPTQTSESEKEESTEIPISYSPPKNTRRRLSKHLSQCDPPSPADVKLARIKSIVEKTEGIEEKIADFVNPTQNKNYLYISETLMKILLDLDTVDSEGFDNVRKARKEGVRTVQTLVDKLEAKLEENKQNSNSE